jgi:hypothetical protein
MRRARSLVAVRMTHNCLAQMKQAVISTVVATMDNMKEEYMDVSFYVSKIVKIRETCTSFVKMKQRSNVKKHQ